MSKDPNSNKYMISASITANGVVDRSDVVGAIFGQTEGLLGDELDLRDLQKSGRMGRIEVDIKSSKGKSKGDITISS
ncbi:MAG: DNA primase, partial [Candidatus Poseidoniia archaeon]|nr:DNA primase [Candidatus Poseidoniia archaeon]